VEAAASEEEIAEEIAGEAVEPAAAVSEEEAAGAAAAKEEAAGEAVEPAAAASKEAAAGAAAAKEEEAAGEAVEPAAAASEEEAAGAAAAKEEAAGAAAAAKQEKVAGEAVEPAAAKEEEAAGAAAAKEDEVAGEAVEPTAAASENDVAVAAAAKEEEEIAEEIAGDAVEPAAAASEEVAASVQEMCEELPQGIKEVSADKMQHVRTPCNIKHACAQHKLEHIPQDAKYNRRNCQKRGSRTTEERAMRPPLNETDPPSIAATPPTLKCLSDLPKSSFGEHRIGKDCYTERRERTGDSSSQTSSDSHSRFSRSVRA